MTSSMENNVDMSSRRMAGVSAGAVAAGGSGFGSEVGVSGSNHYSLIHSTRMDRRI